jgi:transcriptional regulator with XRE-family HTH domain
MSDTPQTINGELLRLKRESMGWLVGDLATRACMSVKQIRQLEEGGSSSFYSESVKLTSAKKVGGILGLTPDEVFGVVSQNPVSTSDEDPFQTLVVPATESVADLEVPVQAAQTSSASNPTDVVDATPIQAESLAPFKPSNDVADAPVQSVAAAAPEQKNKTPLGAIAALFVAALAVAAWMRPEAEPVAVEPPPPLQTLPAEAPDGAASAASAEAAGAPASAASSGASVVSPAVTPAQPQASAAQAASKASAAPLAPSAPTASAPASKPL